MTRRTDDEVKGRIMWFEELEKRTRREAEDINYFAGAEARDITIVRANWYKKIASELKWVMGEE